MPHRWVAPDLRLELTALSADGLSVQQIATRIGKSENAVRSAMTRYGLHAYDTRGLARHKAPRRRKCVSLAPVKWLEPA